MEPALEDRWRVMVAYSVCLPKRLARKYRNERHFGGSKGAATFDVHQFQLSIASR